MICPKQMVHGPCQGVRADGGCEVSAHRCAFVDVMPTRLRRNASPAPINAAGREFLGVLDSGRAVLVEMPSDSLVVATQQTVGRILARGGDAVVLGDAPWSRVQFPAVLRAQWALDAGARPLPGINCRDRNRVAIEGELAGLAAIGVPAVLCLTGDHTDLGDRPDARPVFDLDSVRLAALAAASGMVVVVAESPASSPYPWRLERLEAKYAAGARVCIVNHGSEGDIMQFAESAAARMPDLRLIASVPVVVSGAGLERVSAFFPGAVPEDLRRIAEEKNAYELGVERATRFAQSLLRTGVFAGVDLSAAAGVGEEIRIAEALSDCAALISD